MPSEQPRMPRDTHQHLLNQGGNKHLPLVAGEVATMKENNMGMVVGAVTLVLLTAGITFVSIVVCLALFFRE